MIGTEPCRQNELPKVVSELQKETEELSNIIDALLGKLEGSVLRPLPQQEEGVTAAQPKPMPESPIANQITKTVLFLRQIRTRVDSAYSRMEC